MSIIKYGGGPNPPVRLDKWQNIINVGWGDGDGVAEYLAVLMRYGLEEDIEQGDFCDPTVVSGPGYWTFYLETLRIFSPADNTRRSVSIYNNEGEVAGAMDARVENRPLISNLALPYFEYLARPAAESVKPYLSGSSSGSIEIEGGSDGPVSLMSPPIPGISEGVPFTPGTTATLNIAAQAFTGDIECWLGFDVAGSNQLNRQTVPRAGAAREWENEGPFAAEDVSVDFSSMSVLADDGNRYEPIGLATFPKITLPGYQNFQIWVLFKREVESA
jgi:hypothetical protein